MKEKQSILRIFSIVIIVWQILSGLFKIGICSLVLLCCILVCSSTDVARAAAGHINNALMQSGYFSSVPELNSLFSSAVQNGVTSADVRDIAGAAAVIVGIVLVEILVIKIYFIVAGCFGLRAAKNPEKGKTAFVLGCAGIFISFIQACLTYLGTGFLTLALLVLASGGEVHSASIQGAGSALAFPVVFIVYTVVIGIVRHTYKENTRAFTENTDDNENSEQ